VADLSKVTFFASVGVWALCDAADNHLDQVLALVTGRKVNRILKICGLASVRRGRTIGVRVLSSALDGQEAAPTGVILMMEQDGQP
jgi:hypothetical protein